MSTQSGFKPKVKICGITSLADAQAAVSAGADAIGLVFYEPSSRHLNDLGLASEIATEVGPFTQVVSLFVDAAPSYIERVLATVAVNCIQFHGAERATDCEAFAHPYIKALRMKSGLDVVEAASEFVGARGILLDTYVKGSPGGTGESFNWQRVPGELKNVILAGGLNPSNVDEAVRVAKPYAVDVSGGVESSPGKKDSEKIKAFVERAKI